MNTFRTIVILAISIVPVAHASIPRKVPLAKYSSLWTNSPFTSKPLVVNGAPTVNPLDDYTLTGIAPVPGGYMVTIMNKKDPTKKEVITPESKGKFKVISVNRNPGEVLGTTVVLSYGSIQGTVTFEPELVTIKAPPAAPPSPQQRNPNPLPPGITPAQANQTGNPQRQPRPRIVPPTPKTPGTTQQPARGTRGTSGDRRSERRR